MHPETRRQYPNVVPYATMRRRQGEDRHEQRADGGRASRG